MFQRWGNVAPALYRRRHDFTTWKKKKKKDERRTKNKEKKKKTKEERCASVVPTSALPSPISSQIYPLIPLTANPLLHPIENIDQTAAFYALHLPGINLDLTPIQYQGKTLPPSPSSTHYIYWDKFRFNPYPIPCPNTPPTPLAFHMVLGKFHI